MLKQGARYGFTLSVVMSALLAACGGGGSGGAAPTTGVAPVAPAAAPPVTVSLVGLNDFHGNLLPRSASVTVADPAVPAGTRVSAGGISYLATLVTQIKAQNPGNTLVVGAGDMVGATPATSALFHDEPTVEALGQLGLDITSVGNHEFDKGRDELLRLQNGGCYPKSADGLSGNIGVDTCMSDGKFAGAKYKYLSANVVDQKTGATLFAPYEIRTVAGVQVGFIGLTLKDTPAIVTPAGVNGLSFSDEVDTVNRLVPELKAKGVAAIVVLIHQGGSTTASTINDKSCPGLNGGIVSLTDRFDAAVDVVISGHSHHEYVCTRPDGKLLTQAGAYGLIATKIDLKVDAANKKVLSKEANNIAVVNDIPLKDSKGVVIPLPAGMTALSKDAAMAALVQHYVDISAPLTGAVLGKINVSFGAGMTAGGESRMGELFADIYLSATSGPAYGSAAAQIAMTNPGGIRATLASGTVTFSQLFATMPFGNYLITMDLTGAQLLRVLEQQWELPQPAYGRMLQVSNGFSYSWDASKPTNAAAGSGNRVVPDSIKLNGVAIDMAKVYRVTVNNYMATGGDGFTLFTQGSKRQQGDIDIDAGVAYFRKLGTVPTPALNRITRIN